MTINQLHKLLTKFIAQGQGRKVVHIDKGSYRDNRESDGCVILPVNRASLHCYIMLDEDGGQAYRADGTEVTRTSLVLVGESGSTVNDHPRPLKKRRSPNTSTTEHP